MGRIQDELTGVIVGLARATFGNENMVSETTHGVVLEGLLAMECDEETVSALVDRVEEEKRKLIPLCYSCASPCGRNDSYDMENLWNAEESVCSSKVRILLGSCDLAACACRASARGYCIEEVMNFLYKALFAIGEEWGVDELLSVEQELAEMKLKCLPLLDRTET